jgi:hypothetical protein
VLRSISSGRSGISIVDNHALQMLDYGGEARHAVFGQNGAGLGEGGRVRHGRAPAVDPQGRPLGPYDSYMADIARMSWTAPFSQQ